MGAPPARQESIVREQTWIGVQYELHGYSGGPSSPLTAKPFAHPS